jgi:hypothetical protein
MIGQLCLGKPPSGLAFAHVRAGRSGKHHRPARRYSSIVTKQAHTSGYYLLRLV